MKKIYKHRSLELTTKNKIIFTSFSKTTFYLRSAISAFVLNQGQTPISPFMNFDYNLSDLVDRNVIRIANNSLIQRCDELWVFNKVSDGVLTEIYLAKKIKKVIRYFSITSTAKDFKEINESEIQLEDVSPWMWEWILNGKELDRWHPRLRFNKSYLLVYPAYSKKNFYWQMHISQFCLQKHYIPLNPFMLFRYFLGDSIPRETVYLANNNIVRLCDELWAFGEISDGVLAEIQMKKEQNEKVKYYRISRSNPFTVHQTKPQRAVFEEKSLEDFRNLL